MKQMKKFLSVVLTIILIFGVFPSAPAKGDVILDFTVEISLDSIPGKKNIHHYTWEGIDSECSRNMVQEELLIPEGYGGAISVKLSTTTPDTVSGVTIPGGTISGPVGGTWTGTVPVPSVGGEVYSWITWINSEGNAVDVIFRIPMETTRWVTSVMADGKDITATDYPWSADYEYAGVVGGGGPHRIAIEVADGVICPEVPPPVMGSFSMGTDWKDWTLTFLPGEAEAVLSLPLQSGTTSKTLEITIRHNPQLITGITVNGSPAEGGFTSYGDYDYTATVTNVAGNQIQITAPATTVLDDTEPPSIDGGQWTRGANWKSWTLSFPAGDPQQRAHLILRLQNGATTIDLRISVTLSTDPQLITGVTVNGKPARGEFTAAGYTYTAAVTQATGNRIEIAASDSTWLYGDNLSTTGGEWSHIDEDWKRWMLSFPDGKGGTARLTMSLTTDDMGEIGTDLRIEVSFTPQSSGGGGGGEGPPEDKINVINQTNEPNASSDTILFPRNTVEEGGQSVTSVTTAEIEALVNLAEAHRGDVEDGENEAIIRIEDQNPEGIESYEVILNAEDVRIITDSVIDVLAVDTGASQFRIRSEALSGLETDAVDTVQVKLTKIGHGERPGIDAILAVGERIITVVDGVYTLEIRIPYELEPGEDPNALCIEYLREDGTMELVTESKYDPERKTVSFFPSHLSKYGIAYRPVLFSDVAAGHWANGYITFLAARDVITNSPGSRFRPDDAITRAEFINMAARAFSVANLGQRSLQSYRDVPTNAWYSLAIGWSYMNNISPVLSAGGNFYPQQSLNREEMSTLISNVSLSVGLRLRTENAAVRFSDTETISSYARDAVARMTTSGIVPEAGGGRFLPQNNCTRADAARSISLMMAKMR